MIFFAGCKEIPPTGFSEKPTLLFDGEMVLPEASTCLLKLWLPTKHKDYATFKKWFTRGMLEHGGFGRQ